jgi:hypothetical protein
LSQNNVRLVNNRLKGRQKSKIDFECQRSVEIGVFESILNRIARIRCKHEKFMRQFQKILLFCDCYWWIFECGRNKQSNSTINSVSSRDSSVADGWIRFGVDVMWCYVISRSGGRWFFIQIVSETTVRDTIWRQHDLRRELSSSGLNHIPPKIWHFLFVQMSQSIGIGGEKSNDPPSDFGCSTEPEGLWSAI